MEIRRQGDTSAIGSLQRTTDHGQRTKEVPMIFRSPHPDVTIPEVPLTSFVLQRAQQFGAKPALIDGPSGRTITYEQLAGAVRLVAAGLARRSFQKGQTFAIFSPN